MIPQKQFYENQANTIIKALEKRQMAGYYCETKEAAALKALSLMEEGAVISWGGSVTLDATKIKELMAAKDYKILDRSKATTKEAIRQIYLESFNADYYLMSTNAITLDGELINIDGNGNRVAALIYGPKNVIVLAGMNKVVADEASARKRVSNLASPPNAIRVSANTPCAKTGMCHHCLSEDCICCQTVITRFSRTKDRIKVILIGEALGF
jgi:hypothetical protein